MKITCARAIILASLFCLFTSVVWGQVNIDKPLQMTGGTNAEKQITGVGNPGAADHAVNAGNVQSGALVYANGILSGSTYTVTLTPAPAGYTAGMVVNFKPDLAGTSPVSVNVNGLGAKLIKKNTSTDLEPGDIAAGQVVSLIYDGTNFQLLAGSGNTNIQNQTTADQSAGFRINGNGIFNGGNVGIGAVSPGYKLEVRGTFHAGGSPTGPFSATGGTITTNGGYTIHTFTSGTASFTPNFTGTVEVLVVAGGGAGSGSRGPTNGSPGGGAGGLIYNCNFSVTSGSPLTVTVGAGGLGGNGTDGANGGNSIFATLTAIGGGHGNGITTLIDATGGSGGGGSQGGQNPGLGTAGQGNTGGASSGTTTGGGGGGGAGAVGGASTNTNGGNGGIGLQYSISGIPTFYAGGGGGSRGDGSSGTNNGLGGSGGGGNGSTGNQASRNGAANTGGGGGGALFSASTDNFGGNGGSGIVIVRYVTTNATGITVDASGNTGIGTTAPTQALQVAGNILASGTISSCSDIRYKQDITPLIGSLGNLQKIEGVNYYWRTNEFSEMKFSDEKQIGFIAQELEKIYPELVVTDSAGYKSVDYAKLTPILVEAVKELQTTINELQGKVGLLENENGALKTDNTSMRSAIVSLQAEMETIKSFIFQGTKK